MRIRLVLFVWLVVAASGGVAECAGRSVQAEGLIVFTRSVGEKGARSLYVMAADGSSVRLLAHNASEAAVAPDGRRIVFVRDAALWLMRRDGSGLRRLTRPNLQAAPVWRPVTVDRGPVWSRDGRTIYFSRFLHPYSDSLFSLQADGTSLRRLTQQGTGWDEHPAPSPDGRLIVFASTSESAGMHDLANTLSAVTPLGRRVQLPFRLPATWGSRYGNGDAAPVLRAPAWAPNGRSLAYEASDTSWATGFPGGIYISTLGGSQPRRLAAGGGAPAWSPDGNSIAFTAGHHVWLIRSDGTGRKQLTRTAAFDRDPVWLPAGR